MKVISLLILLYPHITIAQTTATLSGSWKADWNMTLNRASESKKNQYYSLDASMQKRIKDGIGTLTYTFAPDHSCTISWQGIKGPESSSGTWSWDPDGHVLAISVNGSARSYRVTEVDRHTISMSRELNTGQFIEDVILMKN